MTKKMICGIILFFTLSSIYGEKLNFLKKKFFDLGSGEKIELDFTFPKSDLYDFSSVTKKPFKLIKNSNGNFKVIFDIDLLKDSETSLENGQEFTQNFYFTKKNIGSKRHITVKAVYQSSEIDSSSVYAENSVESDNGESVSEEKSIQEDSLASSEDSIAVYSQENKTDLDKLAEEQQDNSKNLQDLSKKVLDKAAVLSGDKTDIEKADSEDTQSEVNNESSGVMIHLIYIIIIVILLILTVVFFLKSLLLKNTIKSDKYKDFYDDCSTILDVDIKGKSVEATISEMMMKLLELAQSRDLGEK